MFTNQHEWAFLWSTTQKMLTFSESCWCPMHVGTWLPWYVYWTCLPCTMCNVTSSGKICLSMKLSSSIFSHNLCFYIVSDTVGHNFLCNIFHIVVFGNTCSLTDLQGTEMPHLFFPQFHLIHKVDQVCCFTQLSSSYKLLIPSIHVIFVLRAFIELCTKLTLDYNNKFQNVKMERSKLSPAMMYLGNWPHSKHEKLTNTNASETWTCLCWHTESIIRWKINLLYTFEMYHSFVKLCFHCNFPGPMIFMPINCLSIVWLDPLRGVLMELIRTY